MKGYLVLKNGVVISGKVSELNKNVLGSLSLSSDNSIKISVGDYHNSIHFDDAELKLLKTQLELNPTIGKIVSDDLPLDYHMYDVQTSIF